MSRFGRWPHPLIVSTLPLKLSPSEPRKSSHGSRNTSPRREGTERSLSSHLRATEEHPEELKVPRVEGWFRSGISFEESRVKLYAKEPGKFFRMKVRSFDNEYTARSLSFVRDGNFLSTRNPFSATLWKPWRFYKDCDYYIRKQANLFNVLFRRNFLFFYERALLDISSETYTVRRWKKKSRGTPEGQEGSFARTTLSPLQTVCWHRTLHNSRKTINLNRSKS